jgi:hypothetical protein
VMAPTRCIPECDFVDLVVDVLEVYMPKFIGIYRMDERWSARAHGPAMS